MSYVPKFPMERDKVVSDKEKVLAKWPDADTGVNTRNHWTIYPTQSSYDPIGHGNSEPEAWADAARRLEGGK